MGQTLTAVDVCYKAKESLRKLLPEETHQYIAPKHYKNNTLTIAVSDPIYAQEVMMRKENIIRDINEKFGKNVIQNLRTQLTTFEKTE